MSVTVLRFLIGDYFLSENCHPAMDGHQHAFIICECKKGRSKRNTAAEKMNASIVRRPADIDVHFKEPAI
jgi:hypothetical protein